MKSSVCACAAEIWVRGHVFWRAETTSGGGLGPGGGGTTLFWPKQVCAAQQGIVFRVLRLTQGMQFHYLASLTGCLSGLDSLNRTCGYQEFFKSNSRLSFIKKILSVWQMKNKADKKRRIQAKYKGLLS